MARRYFLYSLWPKRALKIVNSWSVTWVAINTGSGCFRITITTIAVMKMKKCTRIAATTDVVWYFFTASSIGDVSLGFRLDHLLTSFIQLVEIFSWKVWHVVLDGLPRVCVSLWPKLPAQQHV